MAKFDPSTLTPEQQEKLSPTKWRHTQKSSGYIYSVKARDDQPANVPGQRITGMVRDGNRRVEASVPHLPYEKWIKPCGTVACIPMRTTRVVDNDNGGVSMDTGPYREQMRRELIRSGHVHYETGEPFHYPTRDAWIADREKVIHERQGSQAEDMADAEKRRAHETQADKVKLQEALVDSFKEINQRMAAAAAETKKKGG
jgi:hypothetical protein